jgi:hypothetical protein
MQSLSLTAPLTLDALQFIRTRLGAASAAHDRAKTLSDRRCSGKFPSKYNSGHTDPNPDRHADGNAAVLIPFCNVRGVPGILMQVRGKLRTHSGEVRCVQSGYILILHRWTTHHVQQLSGRAS